MVGWMSYGNRKFEKLDASMRKLIPPIQKTMLNLIPMVDADTNAFNEYMVSKVLVMSVVIFMKRFEIFSSIY